MEKSSRKSSEKNSSMAAESISNSSPQNSANSSEELQKQLYDLEKKLQSKREKEQYSKILPWLKNDQEKIEFLTQPSLEKRNEWIKENQIHRRPLSPNASMKEVIENQDIALGMPMEYVLKSWGEPSSREVSGNPSFRNEKWKYIRNISSSDGFRQEKRYVYFEQGKVVGWETE